MSSEKIIIIGGGGQDGRILKNILKEKGKIVISIGRNSDYDDLILDINEVDKLISSIIKIKPDTIYYLAAKTSTNDAYLLDNYIAIIKGIETINTYSKNYKKINLIIFGSIYQFQSKSLIKTSSPRNFNNHYSAFRNLQEFIVNENLKHFKKVHFYYLCHHESNITSANNFTIDLIKHLNNILAGNVKSKMDIQSPLALREWSCAKKLMEEIITKYHEKNRNFFGIINLKQGATVKKFIESFCNYNHINKNDYFNFSDNLNSSFYTDNNEFEFSHDTQNWIISFNENI